MDEQSLGDLLAGSDDDEAVAGAHAAWKRALDGFSLATAIIFARPHLQEAGQEDLWKRMRQTFKELRKGSEISDADLRSEEEVKTSLAVILSTEQVEITEITKFVEDLAGKMYEHTKLIAGLVYDCEMFLQPQKLQRRIWQ